MRTFVKKHVGLGRPWCRTMNPHNNCIRISLHPLILKSIEWDGYSDTFPSSLELWLRNSVIIKHSTPNMNWSALWIFEEEHNSCQVWIDRSIKVELNQPKVRGLLTNQCWTRTQRAMGAPVPQIGDGAPLIFSLYTLKSASKPFQLSEFGFLMVGRWSILEICNSHAM